MRWNLDSLARVGARDCIRLADEGVYRGNLDSFRWTQEIDLDQDERGDRQVR